MLEKIKDILWETFHIFFRNFNFPCALGLRRVGNPNERSPVFLSGNYTLTVQRVLRKLRGCDCYLLVANSHGSNVWCAAGMNEFTEYDVIDAINVSGIKDLVRHRRIIAPVYAAPGIDIRVIKQVSGFNIQWGPTHLDDLPRYIANGLKRTNDMFQVKFGLQDRLEQALANSWCYTMTLAFVLIFWPLFFLKVIGIIFGVYLFGFTFYPLLPEEVRFRRTLAIAAVLMGAMAAFGWWQGWEPADYALWESVLAATILLMAGDGCGSSPLFKSTIVHWLTRGDYKSAFSPIIDPALCINCMQCVLVCPRDVFAAVRGQVKTVVAVNPEQCEECLACYKQCPTDAIFNRSGKVKGDVKSVPNLAALAARDWSHLRDEERWIGMPTTVRSGIPVVIEASAAAPVPAEAAVRSLESV